MHMCEEKRRVGGVKLRKTDESADDAELGLGAKSTRGGEGT